jgi:cytochrome c biogenesis protein
LALLIVLSAISTFQGAPAAFFNSLGFFAIVFLFFVNLLCCTIYRFSRELKKKTNRNFGPDLLHGGVVIFMLAALLSTYSRMEGQIGLMQGESVTLPNGSILTLEEFEYLHYENGRPKDWISYITIERGDEIVYSRYPLRVNYPLKIDGYTLYQVSYGEARGSVYSIIQAVREPFFALVLTAFIVCGFGLFFTIFAKLRRRIITDD